MVDNVESARHRVKIVTHKLYQEYHLIKEALLKRHIMYYDTIKKQKVIFIYLFTDLFIYLFIDLSIYLFYFLFIY